MARMTSEKSTSRLDEIILVRAVGVSLAVGVVLVERDRVFGLQCLVGDAQRAAHHLLARDVIERRFEGLRHSGDEYSGWAWST